MAERVPEGWALVRFAVNQLLPDVNVANITLMSTQKHQARTVNRTCIHCFSTQNTNKSIIHSGLPLMQKNQNLNCKEAAKKEEEEEEEELRVLSPVRVLTCLGEETEEERHR